MQSIRDNASLSVGREPSHADQQTDTHPHPVYFKEAISSVQGFKNFLRYKVSADQLYGTIFLIVMAYSNMQGLKSAWKRQVVKDGEDPKNAESLTNQKNMQDVISSVMTLALNFWSLVSSRSAVPPDGNGYKERMIDVVKHPERSHEHMKYFFFVIKAFMSEWGNIKYGFTKAGMPEEKFSKRLQSVTLPVSIGLGFIDLFEDKGKQEKKSPTIDEKEKSPQPPMFQTSQSKAMKSKLFYPFKILKNSWQNNPKRIISILVGLVFPFIQLQEGLSKKHSMQERYKNAFQTGSDTWIAHKQKLEVAYGKADKEDIISSIKKQERESFAESKSLIKRSVISIIMGIAGAFYSLDQLYKGEKVKTAGQRDGASSHTVAERGHRLASEGVSR